MTWKVISTYVFFAPLVSSPFFRSVLLTDDCFGVIVRANITAIKCSLA